jgi:hypothetical protein
MLRRSMLRCQVNRAPARPGPTLYGWGRTEQKRRLEYETTESKYHKRDFNKSWDLAGVEQRYSDFMQVRTYFSLGSRWGTWLYNLMQFYVLSMFPVFAFMHFLHKSIERYDDSIRLAAWW